jgi:hypothetical protein
MGSSHFPNGTACGERERQWNIARDFLGTFRHERSVSVPKFPVLFPLYFGRCRAKCPDLFEKSGAGGGNRTRDIQLGKLFDVNLFLLSFQLLVNLL